MIGPMRLLRERILSDILHDGCSKYMAQELGRHHSCSSAVHRGVNYAVPVRSLP